MAYCSGCGQKAVYERRWEGSFYCKACLLTRVEKTFLKTVSKEKMLQSGDKVAVGLSGGKDSSTLLYLLNKNREKFSISLVAVLIDEGIAGYRSITKEAAERLCSQLGVPLKVFSYQEEFGTRLDDIQSKLGNAMNNRTLKNAVSFRFQNFHPSPDLSPEYSERAINWCSWCGVLRRSLLNRAAKSAGATKLAVGHNLDDEAQSVVMNFFRGDLNQMQRLEGNEEFEGAVKRIKPLKNIPEKETTLFAVLNNLPFSDAECPYSHDMMRRKVGAFLNEMELNHPGSKIQIVRFYGKLKPMLPKSERDFKKCACGEPTSRTICRKCELLSELSLIKP